MPTIDRHTPHSADSHYAAISYEGTIDLTHITLIIRAPAGKKIEANDDTDVLKPLIVIRSADTCVMHVYIMNIFILPWLRSLTLMAEHVEKL